RAPAPAGRELAVRIERFADVGWTVVAHIPGAPGPQASPAPLRRADADELASAMASMRAGDAPLDRPALADALVRASFAAVGCDVDVLDLARIVVGPRGAGAIIADARARLRRKRP